MGWQIKSTIIRQPMLKSKTHSGFHDLFSIFDMSKSTNTVVYFDWKTVIYIYACGKCRTIYAAKFEQTIIHQHVHLRRKSQSHSPAHVRMRLYHR